MIEKKRGGSINNILNSSFFSFIVGTLTIPVMNDSKQVRVSSISSGIVGQPIVFTSKLIEISVTKTSTFLFSS
jgi:hypothetical protein